jgi:hypothetical protein
LIEEKEIKLLNNIIYDKEKYIFKNIDNNNSYEIPEHYSKFMNILIENKGIRVKYNDICKVINEDNISD